MDIIFLRDLRIETVIGIFDWEREIKQTVVLDLEMGTDVARAAASDHIDDALDYGSSGENIGKNIGDDLAEGKPTLPLIYAMRNGTPAQVKAIRQAIENGGRSHIQPVLEAIESTNAIAYTAQAAQREADTAIEALAELPASSYKEALYGLAEFSVNRSY